MLIRPFLVELESELFVATSELEKAKATEARLVEMEALVEVLTIEFSDVNNAESEARKLVEQWKKKADLLETQLEETNESRKSSLEALASVKQQLEECYALLQDKDCEVSVLTGKVDSLNLEVSRHKTELDGSIQKLAVALQEAAELEKTIALLKSDLQIAEATKIRTAGTMPSSAPEPQTESCRGIAKEARRRATRWARLALASRASPSDEQKVRVAQKHDGEQSVRARRRAPRRARLAMSRGETG